MSAPPRHFLHQMKSSDPAPTGDTESWFRFYKWDVEGEAFIPRRAGAYLPVSPGDLLWFSMDDVLVGCAEVLRALIDPMGGNVQEVWFEPLRGQIPNESIPILSTDFTMSGDEVPAAVAVSWLDRCLVRQHENSPPATLVAP